MTKRGRRSREKKEKKVKYRGGIVIPTEKQRKEMEKAVAVKERREKTSKFKSATDKGKGKAIDIVQDSDSDSTNSDSEAVQSVRHRSAPKKKNVDYSKLAKLTCPRLSRMSEWSLSEYEEYDDFLIKKWKIRGWDPDDAVYVQIRDRNSRVAWIARMTYKQK